MTSWRYSFCPKANKHSSHTLSALSDKTDFDSDTHWSVDDQGLLRYDDHIWVPDSDNLHLWILLNNHDHPIVGHYGQNKTLDLVWRNYMWLGIHSFIKDYCKSCTNCTRSKAPQHRPYGNLQQLPIPEKPWNSISMDFIEQLPPSLGFTAILVVVDWLSKQAIFILTYDTITSMQLTQLFILHVFSKHGVPSHMTSDCRTEFVSHFFKSLRKLLIWSFILPRDIIQKAIDKPNAQIKHWNNKSICTATTNRMIGLNFFPLHNSPTTSNDRNIFILHEQRISSKYNGASQARPLFC